MIVDQAPVPAGLRNAVLVLPLDPVWCVQCPLKPAELGASKQRKRQSLTDLIVDLKYTWHRECHCDSEWNWVINHHTRLIRFALKMKSDF